MLKLIALFGLVALACGFPTKEESNSWRVVGGSNAGVGEAPYQISMRSASNSHFCGGSIINSRTIVSAAHCLIGQSASNVRIVTGTIYLNSGGNAYFVSRITYHSSYNPNNLSNDVGVVITSSNIQMSNVVSAIPLGTSNIGAGMSLLLTGWGTTSYPGSAPNNLQKLWLNSISVSQCQSSLQGIGYISANHLCVFNRAGQGACHGDSGGPLVGGGQLAGIVSWGYPCAKGFPDVFTRVSSYYSWILSNAQN